LTSQDAHLCVRDRLYALMTELADEAEGDDEDLFELDECDAEDLEALPTVVLAEKLVALQAEFLEIRRAVKRGQRLDLDQHAEEETTRVMTCRQRLLAMPSKLASSLSICSTEAEAERLILDELEDGVRELASKWVSRADILACRPGVATMKTKPKESVLLPRDQQETLIRESIAQARKVLAPARAEEA
jgi:hypothetical protein